MKEIFFILILVLSLTRFLISENSRLEAVNSRWWPWHHHDRDCLHNTSACHDLCEW